MELDVMPRQFTLRRYASCFFCLRLSLSETLRRTEN
jgi:hypothetical protein